MLFIRIVLAITEHLGLGAKFYMDFQTDGREVFGHLTSKLPRKSAKKKGRLHAPHRFIRYPRSCEHCKYDNLQIEGPGAILSKAKPLHKERFCAYGLFYFNTHTTGCALNYLHGALHVVSVEVYHLLFGYFAYLIFCHRTDLLFVRLT